MSVTRKAILTTAAVLFALLIMLAALPLGATASPLWSDLPDTSSRAMG
jgi:hypothetical protein